MNTRVMISRVFSIFLIITFCFTEIGHGFTYSFLIKDNLGVHISESSAALDEFDATALESVEGIHFKPELDFQQGQPLSTRDSWLLTKRKKRKNDEVRALLEKAQADGIQLSITGHLRGIDGPGSTLDLPEFQEALTNVDTRGFVNLPSTPTIASEFTATIRFELAENPDEIVYIAPDYGITEDKPYITKSNVRLQRGRAPNGQKDAPAFIFGNLFRLRGIKIIMEGISPMAAAGGMESSNVFNTGLIAAASMLTGADLSPAEIFSLAVKLENDEFGGLTGGQGHLATLLGNAYRHVWLSGIRNLSDQTVNPYSAVSIPLLEEGELDSVEEHMVLVQAGKEYIDGSAAIERNSAMINFIWTDLLRVRDEVAIPLLYENLTLTTEFTQALQQKDFEVVAQTVMRYLEIRTGLVERWLKLLLDAKNGNDVPDYAHEFVEKVFTNPNYHKNGQKFSDFQLIRNIYEEEGEEKLRQSKLFSLGSSALIEEAKKQGIAITPVGAGGPGANMIAIDPQGISHLEDFLRGQGLSEIAEEEAQEIVRGTGTLKGYIPFKVGKNPMRFEGFEKLGLTKPEIPPLTTITEKDVGQSNIKKIQAIVEKVKRLLDEAKDQDNYFIVPTNLGDAETQIKKGDSVVNIDFRGDRSIANTRLLAGDPDFEHFPIQKNLGLTLSPFVDYDEADFSRLGIQAVVPESYYENTAVDYLLRAGKTVVVIAESEKFKHVAYFFNGKRWVEHPNYRSLIIKSHELDSHAEKPAMRVDEIVEEITPWILGQKTIDDKPINPEDLVVVVNFANMDMIGHSKDFEAAVQGALKVDEGTGKIRDAVRKANGVLMVTADHGSGEEMAILDEAGIPVTDDSGAVVMNTAHSYDNQVPFIIEGLGDVALKSGDEIGLVNVGPTLLELTGVPLPENPNAAESLFKNPPPKPKGPTVLLIRDGWGIPKHINPEALEWNAIHQAKERANAGGTTWHDTELAANNPSTFLGAHGHYVGLPDVNMGDSENGHMTMGLLRPEKGPILSLDAFFESGEINDNQVFRAAIENAKKKGVIHVMGQLSEGGVHSHTRHYHELLKVLKEYTGKIKRIVIHPIFDGRDIPTDIKPAWQELEELLLFADQIGILEFIEIGVVAGRFYPKDRDANNNEKKGKPSKFLWNERLRPWYEAIIYDASLKEELSLKAA